MDIEQTAAGILTNAIGQAYARMASEFAWSVGPGGESAPVWPSQSDIVGYVLPRVDLSELGLSAGGEGLTSAQIFRLFTGPERDAIFGLVQVEPLILQALMTMALTDARIPLDAPDFLAFVQGLGPAPLGYGVLSEPRMQQVLAGEPPA